MGKAKHFSGRKRKFYHRRTSEKYELFIVGNKKVIYRIGHRIRAVDVKEIREIP